MSQHADQSITLVGIRLSYRALTTLSIMLATTMQSVDTTIANVALPHIQGTMSATHDQVAWILTSYIVAAAVFTAPTGFMAMRFGRKRVFLASVTGFTVASMLCGAASSVPEMVIYRLLQGACGAALVPLSQAVLLDSYPPAEHGKAMAIWGVGIMVGPILGPTLGGYLTEWLNWRWVFYINAPIGMLTVFGLWFFSRETDQRKLPFDWIGFLLLSAAVAAGQLAFDRGESQDWFASLEIIAELVMAGLCLYLFIVHTTTTQKAFINPLLFHDRNFVTGLGFIFVIGILIMATMALLPPFLQQLMGYPVAKTGEVLAPRGIGMMISMMMAGRLINRYDPRLLVFIGLALTAVSLYDMAHYNLEVTPTHVIRSGIMQGLGMGIIIVPLSILTYTTLPQDLRTEAASLFSLVRNIGSSLGISILISHLSSQSQIHQSELVETVNAYQSQYWIKAGQWSLDNLASLQEEISRQAAAMAYVDNFYLIMAITLATMPLLLVLRKPNTPG